MFKTGFRKGRRTRDQIAHIYRIMEKARVPESHLQKTEIMASGPIISWQIDGETMEAVMDFIFWGSKITADGDCSHEVKRSCSLEENLFQK